MNKAVKICIFKKDTPKETVILSNGDAILDNICTSCKVTENLDGTYELDAEFIIDDAGLWEHLQEEAILKIKVDYGDEYFRITKPRKTRTRIIIYAVQVTIYETIHLWLNDVRPTGLNGTAAINWILDGALGVKELEVYSNISVSNTAYYEDMNMYKAIHDCDQSFLNRWGGEIQRRGYLLRILDKVGKDRGVEIRSCKNLKGFEANTDVDSITTRIKPKGKDGITIDGFIDSPIINNYARVYTKEFTYSDVKVNSSEDETEGFSTLEGAQTELKRLAQLEYTENKVDIISADYTIDFVDLSQTEEYKDYIKAERVYIGDKVSVFESKLNINVVVRAIERKYNVLTQKVEEIKLSNKDIGRKSINDVMVDISKDIEKNDNSIEKWIQSFINSGIKDSYVFYNKEELVVCDSPTIEEAIHVWRFNKNGLAHSLNGYQGPYDVALTSNGQINANRILTGTLKGQYIDARNLTVTDGNGNTTMSISSDGIIKMIQGLIDISEEGIHINLEDSENNIVGYALYDGQGIQIFDTEDNAISYLTREGSYIEDLKVDNFDCWQVMKIANRSGCSLNWYIAVEATGDGTGRDENNKANSLNDVLRSIRQYGLTFTDRLNIYIESGAVIKEDILIQDMNGSVIKICFSKDVVIDTNEFVIEDCTARIYLEAEVEDGNYCLDDDITAEELNKKALIKTNDSTRLFRVSNCNYISMQGFRFRGNGGNLVEAYNASNVFIKDCDISNFDYGAYTDDMSKICIAACRGNLQYLGYVGYGGIISSTRAIPKCSETDIVDRRQSGTWVKESSYLQYSSLYQESTTTSTSTNTTSSFGLTDLYTKTEGTGKNVNGRKGYVGQGKFQSYKAHRGYIELNTDEILTTLNNKTDSTIKLRMTRLNTKHGYNGKIPHPIIRAVGNNITTDYWDSNVKFNRGETNDIVLPESIVNAIKQGATRLELWAETNQQQQYSFYNNINLIIEGANKEKDNTTPDTSQTFKYADELVENAMTYWRNCTNEGDGWSAGTVYRASNTVASGTAKADKDVTGSIWVKCGTKYYKAIDCSTVVCLSLQDYSYENGPYSSLSAFNAYRANRTKPRSGSNWGIYPGRSAADIGEYFYNKGWIVPLESIGSASDNYSGLKKGDILFYARKNSDGTYKKPDRFMKISHVAIVGDISSSTGKRNLIESTSPTNKKHTVNGKEYNAGCYVGSIESKYPETIVLVGRIMQ